MALLGSFIDSRIKTWHVNRKTFTFKHGLPRQPDFVIVCGIGINKKYVRFGFEANKKTVKVVRWFIGNKKKKVTTRVVSVVAHSIIK